MISFNSHTVRKIIRKAVTGAAIFSVTGVAILCIYGQRAGAAEMQTGDMSAIEASAGSEEAETAGETSAEAETSPEAAPQAVLEEEVVMEEIGEDPKAPFKEAGLSEDDWRLVVVNHYNEVPDGYEVVTVKTYDGQLIDEWVADDLEEMIDDCKDAGYSPYICSGYRTNVKQVSLFNADVRKYKMQGYSEEEAEKLTMRTVAIPGTSEHEMGLAADIVSRENQRLDRSQEDTGTQQWLMENCWKYGFILRYPEDKEEITEIDYEPWHYRYVGREAAEYIYEHNLSLEEFMGMTQENE